MRVFLIAAAMAALTGCGAPDPGKVGEAVDFTSSAQGATSQPGCAERRDDDRLIRNAEDWSSWWAQVHPDSQEPAPDVDFSSASILATCGWLPSPGYSSTITSVKAGSDSAAYVNVEITDLEPGPNCVNAAVVMYGYHAVKVQRVVDAAAFAHHPASGPPC